MSLPRVSRAQYGVGSPVSRSNLRPGDLVFFYSPISHVSLYAGSDQIIDAPRPGKVVRYSSLDYMQYTGLDAPARHSQKNEKPPVALSTPGCLTAQVASRSTVKVARPWPEADAGLPVVGSKAAAPHQRWW